MAKFPYDVNTTRRIIDVYKQFPGGLKTVDTDDALGSVFLRQSENVSLSEFNFLEKRYGIIEKESIKQTNDTLQGYWEYMGFAIYAIQNRFYYRNSAGTESAVTQIFEENNTYRYPATRPTYDTNTGFGSTGPFRDMNAVNVNNVLYIFTGHYPVYVKLDSNNVPKFYWFSITIPTYDEIVVTGHNLLEDDYDKAYGFTTPNAYTTGSSAFANISYPRITSGTNFYPKLPFVREGANLGTINFEVNAQFPNDMSNFTTTNSQAFWEIELDSVRYRTSLPGATNTAYTEVDLDSVTFEEKNNYADSASIPYVKGTVKETDLANSDVSRTEATAISTDGNNHTYKQVIYRINSTSITVEKDEFLKNKNYAFRVLQESPQGSDALAVFDMSSNAIDYTYTVNNTNYTISALNQFYYHIYPLNSDGNIIPDRTVLFEAFTRSSNIFKFNLDNVNDGNGLSGRYRDDTVHSYRLEFYHQVVRPIAYNQAAPAPDLTGNGQYYHLRLEKSGSKTAANVGNRITSNHIPHLDVSLTNLISGRYDFEITFARNQYTYSNGQLTFGGTQLFSGTIFDVNITAEKLEDFPGITADFLPKLKPIWSCNKVIEHYGKLMVWGSEDDTNGMPTAVFYSFPDRPTYFPSKFYLDFTNDTNEKVEAVTPYMNVLVAQTASRTFGIRGNSGLIDAPAPYVPFGINPTVGTIAYKSVRPVRNQLFFLSKQGISALSSLYAVDETYNVKFVDRSIKNIVPQDSKAIGIQFDNQYWLNFPEKRITLRWYIDKKAWVQDKYQGWADNGFEGVFKYQIRDGKLEFITYPSTKAGTGQNKTIYKIGVDDTIPTDLFQPIKAILETSFLNQNYPFHHKNYKEAKLDFTLQNEYNLGRNALFDSNVSATADGGLMSTNTDTNTNVTTITVTLDSPTKFKRNHRYRVVLSIGAQGNDAVASLGVSLGTANPVENITQRQDANGNAIPEFEFVVNNTLLDSDASTIDLILPSGQTFNLTSDDVSIRDVTYDDSLAFSTYVISENKTLNFDNSPGYNQATVDVAVDLTEKGRLGDWSFGQSEFGDKVTAVKTIKLSGKGYNAKIYIEDLSKSKWTLESLGLTYKMRRARSR